MPDQAGSSKLNHRSSLLFSKSDREAAFSISLLIPRGLLASSLRGANVFLSHSRDGHQSQSHVLNQKSEMLLKVDSPCLRELKRAMLLQHLLCMH